LSPPQRPAGAAYAASHTVRRPAGDRPAYHRLSLRHDTLFNGCMPENRIDFSAPATLRKWPSVNNERVSASLGARTYMIIESTLDECIRKFMLQPKSQRHLYEIHTVPQSDIVGARSCRRNTSSSWRA